MRSISHSSAYCRIGLEPMNTHASIGTPVRCTASAIGWMSTTIVRAAQFAPIRSPLSAISRHRVSTACRCRGPEPGSPTLAVSIPSPSIRWSSRTLTSSGGSITDGLCRPSRSVSSSSIAARGRTGGTPPWADQS
jgi:hypothetical protein